MRVAITGASGFVGNRIIESFFLRNVHDVMALARSNSGLALPARFDLRRRVCDHFSVEEFTEVRWITEQPEPASYPF